MDGNIDKVREALVDRVITFFNNRVTIGEIEDECGDLVSVLELDKYFRADLAKMLSAIDPEAIRREEHKRCIALVEKNRFAIPVILAQVAYNTAIDDCISILSAEPAQDDGKEEAEE